MIRKPPKARSKPVTAPTGIEGRRPAAQARAALPAWFQRQSAVLAKSGGPIAGHGQGKGLGRIGLADADPNQDPGEQEAPPAPPTAAPAAPATAPPEPVFGPSGMEDIGGGQTSGLINRPQSTADQSKAGQTVDNGPGGPQAPAAPQPQFQGTGQTSVGSGLINSLGPLTNGNTVTQASAAPPPANIDPSQGKGGATAIQGGTTTYAVQPPPPPPPPPANNSK